MNIDASHAQDPTDDIRHEVTDRYVVSLTVPHLPMKDASRAARDMGLLLASDTTWVAEWTACWLHNLIATLPVEDPWRSLAGQTEDVTMTQPGLVVPEGKNGAWTQDGHTFGSVGNSLDLNRLTCLDLSRDPALAAVADPLRPDSAALLAAASHSVSTVLDVLEEPILDLCPADVVDLVDAALRWALHRRASYVGLDDPYPWVASGAAQRAADHVTQAPTTGDPLDWNAQVIKAGQIDPGTHRVLSAVTQARR